MLQNFQGKDGSKGEPGERVKKERFFLIDKGSTLCIQGEVGPQGPVGEQGIKGATGERGVQGEQVSKDLFRNFNLNFL